MQFLRAEVVKKLNVKTSKNPYDIYKMVLYKWLGFFGSFIGMNVFDPNYKWSLATIIIFVSAYLGVIPCQYTFMFYDLKVGVECIALSIILFQVN